MAESYKRLQITYGEQFLRYVLAIPEGKNFPEDISPAAEQVVNFLTALTSKLPLDEDGGTISASMTLSSQLSQYVPEQPTVLAHQLRAWSGGEVAAVPESSDPVLEHLNRVAHDLWPIYLLPPPSSHGPKLFWLSSRANLFQYPFLNELLTAFLNDDSLSKLFPGAELTDIDNEWSSAFNVQSHWIMNAGSGGSQQLFTVVGNLLSDAVVRTLLRHGKLDHDEMISSASESLDTLRQLADGMIVDVPTIIGFSGVQLEEGTEIGLTTGTVRQIRPVERDIILNQAHSVSAVIETTFPLQILEVSEFDPADDNWYKKYQKYNSRMEEAQRTFQHGIDQIRLSILLSSREEEYLGSNEVGRFVADPTRPGGFSTWAMDARIPASFVLAGEQKQEVVSWYRLVAVKHPESLDIAMKRLLSSASTRFDSHDAFIDALIVWENAFGTKQETTFRVTGALAKLIEPDDFSKRNILQKELSALYGVRSALIHGGKEPSAARSLEYRQRSIGIAIDCLRKLYKDRPDLLAINSEERSKILLLEQ